MKIPPSIPPLPLYFKVSRPSHIACTVTAVYVTCKETALHVYKNSCKVLIRLSKTNLNLQSVLLFFCHVLGCLLFSFILLSYLLLRCADFLFVFMEAEFVAQLQNTYLFVNLNACFHSSYFAARKISLNRFTGLMYKLYYHDL